MKKIDTFELVLTSMFIGIILILSLVPQLGFITILPGVSLTIVHIPTLIGIFLLKPRSALILGITFGLGSLMASYIYAVNPTDLAFQNPLVSVLPRALFGLLAYYIFYGLKKIEKLKFGNTLIFGIVSLITIFGLYFGSLRIANDATHSKYNSALTSNNKFYEDHDQSELPPFSDEELDDLLINANNNYRKTSNILIPIILVISTGFIAIYYTLINNNMYEDLVIPASFVVSTLVHTFVVLISLVLFGGILQLAFGDAVNLIYSITLSNGLIESIVALIVGTPIYFAIKKVPVLKRLKNN